MNHTYLPHYEWALLLGAAMLSWCFGWVRPRYGSIPAALIGYLSLSSVWVWVWVENRYLTINTYDQMALRYFSADSMARLMMVIVPFMALAENRLSFYLLGKIAATMFVILNSLWIFAFYAKTGCVENLSCGGAGNPSIMVSLMVCTLPIVISSWKRQWWIALATVACVILSKSSVALGLLGVYSAYALISATRGLLTAFALSLVPIIAGYFTLGRAELFSSGDRFKVWAYMMSYWSDPRNLLFGTGLGTYHVFSINLQAVKHLAGGYWWDTMHNDFLEMLFVGGVVGASLLCLTYLMSLWKSIKEGEMPVAMSILLYGLYMGVNPALHHALPVLFGAWLFLYALKRTPTVNLIKECYV